MKLRLPANVDMPDRILAGLTLRQLLIVGGGVLVVWALYLAIGRSMGAAFAVVALPLGAAGWALATSTPQGIGIDRLAFLAARFLLMPRRLVLAPRGIAVSPKLSRRRLAPIDIPPFGVNEEGLADLGPHGFAVVCRASGINLSLRAEDEQRGLMAGSPVCSTPSTGRLSSWSDPTASTSPECSRPSRAGPPHFRIPPSRRPPAPTPPFSGTLGDGATPCGARSSSAFANPVARRRRLPPESGGASSKQRPSCAASASACAG